jgi:hypothetical protein
MRVVTWDANTVPSALMPRQARSGMRSCRLFHHHPRRGSGRSIWRGPRPPACTTDPASSSPAANAHATALCAITAPEPFGCRAQDSGVCHGSRSYSNLKPRVGRIGDRPLHLPLMRRTPLAASRRPGPRERDQGTRGNQRDDGLQSMAQHVGTSSRYHGLEHAVPMRSGSGGAGHIPIHALSMAAKHHVRVLSMFTRADGADALRIDLGPRARVSRATRSSRTIMPRGSPRRRAFGDDHLSRALSRSPGPCQRRSPKPWASMHRTT